MSKAAKQPKPANGNPTKAKPITLEEVSGIQSRFAKTHDGKVPKNSWVARLQRVAQRNADQNKINKGKK
ncbi:hypothetical protein [Azovibrio restrictus]|uniref:hypothetical protein n=1 Tax=Azovibrio restrictus TaxID=146938 RepID=UPI0026E93B43|nr:hypothetical protein [Azovibrio restrictus]MDD3483682.1 hypothetical protein [Azovibrio restrictus]